MPKHYSEETELLDPLQRTRCPSCGYFHTDDTLRCALCISGDELLSHAADPALFDDDAVLTPAAPEASVPMAGPAPGAERDAPVDGTTLPHPPRPRCRCCQRIDQKDLDRDLCDPLLTQRAIATRYGVSLHSLTQHRRVCIGLPPYSKKESGERRQSLRRLAPNNQQQTTCPSFLDGVRKELATITKTLAHLSHRAEALQAQQRTLTLQARCLGEYLDLEERKQ
mgnify:FL=1